MVVGDRDAWSVPEDVPELQSEFEPGCCVLFVIVALVPSEEHQVWIMQEDVAYVVWAQPPISARVAGECRKGDLFALDGVATDGPKELGALPMAESVGHVLSGTPVVDPQEGRPAQVVDLRPRLLSPFPIPEELNANSARLPWVQWEQLRGELQ